MIMKCKTESKNKKMNEWMKICERNPELKSYYIFCCEALWMGFKIIL